MEERLQKLMAHAGIASRRECERLIEKGHVRVNGRVAKVGDKADPNKDRIEFKGQVLSGSKQEEHVYIALNKPKGVISSLQDELGEGRRVVRDLIPVPGHLYPVGRLDKQSEGLILMTNDGNLAHKLTHPRYGHTKKYKVVIEGKISQDNLDKWRNGVYLDGRRTAPADVKIMQTGPNFTRLEIIMREGRKRQIRRISNMLGHPVNQLVREEIGPLQLGNLKTGDWRYLDPKEVKALQKSVRQSKPRRSKPRQNKKYSKHKNKGKNKATKGYNKEQSKKKNSKYKK